MKKKALMYGLSVAVLLALVLVVFHKPQTDRPDTSQPDPAAISTQADVSTPEPPAETEPEPPAQTQAVPEQLASTTKTVPDEAESSQPPEETELQEPAEEVQLFTDVNETVYAISEVNLRASYTAESEKLGSLTRGQSVTRTGTSIAGTEAEGWSRVQLSNGTTAYISNKYLSTTKPTTQTTNNGGSSGGGGTTQTQPASQGGTTDTQPSSGTDTSYEERAARRQKMLEEAGYIGTDPSKRVDFNNPDECDAFVEGIVSQLDQ